MARPDARGSSAWRFHWRNAVLRSRSRVFCGRPDVAPSVLSSYRRDAAAAAALHAVAQDRSRLTERTLDGTWHAGHPFQGTCQAFPGFCARRPLACRTSPTAVPLRPCCCRSSPPPSLVTTPAGEDLRILIVRNGGDEGAAPSPLPLTNLRVRLRDGDAACACVDAAAGANARARARWRSSMRLHGARDGSRRRAAFHALQHARQYGRGSPPVALAALTRTRRFRAIATQEQWGFSGIRNPTIPFRGGPTPASCLPLTFPSIVRAEPLCGFDAAVIDTRFRKDQCDRDYHGRFVQRIAPSPLYSPFEPGNDFTLPPSSQPGTSPACRVAIRRSGWRLCTRRCQGRSTRACATRSGRRRCSLYPRRPRPACDTAAGPRRSSGHSVDRSQTVWPTR